MEKTMDKPRLCEVLGVDVGERFKVRDDVHEKILGPFFVRGDGYLVGPSAVHSLDACYALIEAINHPEKIVREPRLTDTERDICRLLGAKWVSRDTDSSQVYLWKTEPEPQPGGVWVGGKSCAQMWARFFPSVKSGQLVQVEDAT